MSKTASEPQSPAAPPANALDTLLAECQAERTALWQLLCSSDQWQRIQQLDGAITALQQLQETQQESTTPKPDK